MRCRLLLRWARRFALKDEDPKKPTVDMGKVQDVLMHKGLMNEEEFVEAFKAALLNGSLSGFTPKDGCAYIDLTSKD